MSSGKQDDVDLPANWWQHLNQYWQKWDHPDLEGFCSVPPTLSSKTLYRAKIRGCIKQHTLDRLLLKMKNDFSTTDQMVKAWKEDLVPRPETAIAAFPHTFSLTTNKEMPQWADHRIVPLLGQRLQTLSCEIQTQSAYFRFGFKLLHENSRVFGDGSIQTHEANLVFHIGRNDWDRPNIGIAKSDIFFTWYANGISSDEDRRLFREHSRLTANLVIKVHDDYVVDFSVNGTRCLHRAISPTICRKLVVLAWGDRTPFKVEVRKFFVTTTQMQ